ncbi:MAG: 3-phosphoshikimate 1-carboxyvinyltransferase [Muribaculaceae bacterium]|nr:3-phosphoshikimate 1-carboxyvinyltransferase [Muribaculaceae bacterium]
MIELPPSKSIGARYLVATFFNGTLPADPLFEENDDLMVLQQALLEVYSDEEPIDYGDSPIDVGASGTALRFVTALCASTPGADYVITGTPRLMERPMDPLLNLLREAGAGIQSLGENGRGPYRVTGNELRGGEFSIRGDISSQFISALMLVAPSWEKGMKLFFSTPLVSRPYIEMTARLMEQFGISTKLTDTFVEVDPGKYKEPKDFRVEADWSSASFFYEACALGCGDLEMANLRAPEFSLQGDSAAAGIFSRLGVESEFSVDGAKIQLEAEDHPTEPSEQIQAISFRNCPDLVLPFAVASLCRGLKFRIEDVAHLHLKESDRIKTLQTEARKLGFVVEGGDDFIEWKGETCPAENDPLIETYDDHRLAMSFAMAALKTGKIRISHPEVVEKSFIDFWNQLPFLGLICSQDGEVMTVEKG